MTNCWQVFVLPCTSTTVQVTVFVPTVIEAGALLVTLATPQLSEVAGGVSDAPEAVHKPLSAFTVMLVEHVMLGAWVSSTVTNCVQVFVLPPKSVTVQVTSVVPTEKIAGASLVTVPTPQLSAVTG